MMPLNLLTAAMGVVMVGLVLWPNRRLLTVWLPQKGLSMQQAILFGVVLLGVTAATVTILNRVAVEADAADSFSVACGIDDMANGTLPPGCQSA